MLKIKTHYQKIQTVILGSSFFTEGGDWRSIYFYARYQESLGQKIALVNMGGKRGFRQFLASTFFAPRILVNGLGTCSRWEVLLLCWFRRDVRIYLHETRYSLDGFQRESPLKYRVLKKILKRNSLLCVSHQAAAHYRERFGSERTHVVHECPGIVDPTPLDPAKKHIVMVGSINHRKGAELFSQVADLAAASHPDWKFHWVGGLATMDPIYQSPAVTWHGWQWSPLDIVRQCDVFFLSSCDDPCPLAALEALHLGKRCVAYRETGIAELIEGKSGCEVMEAYMASDALAALEKVFLSPCDVTQIAFEIKAKTGLEAFKSAIDIASRVAG
ncbi:MAG: glycosyltransferase family 4 protein [bacterium]